MHTKSLASVVSLLTLVVACGSSSTTDGNAGSSGTSGSNGNAGSGGSAGNAGSGGSAGRAGSSGAAGTAGGGGTAGVAGAGGASGNAGSAGDPYNTPTVCSSNSFWTSGDHGSPEMHPGKACETCHVALGQATGKTFDVSGTVFPTAHEPDDCNGVGGAQVIITDANGQEHALDVNSAGNFYHEDLFGLQKYATPIKAKVVFNGQERVMLAPQTTGDCNSCHTEAGSNGAPGRIMLP